MLPLIIAETGVAAEFTSVVVGFNHEYKNTGEERMSQYNHWDKNVSETRIPLWDTESFPYLLPT